MARKALCTLFVVMVAVGAGCESPADIHKFSYETMGTVASGTIEVWDKTMPIPPEQIVAATFDSVGVKLGFRRIDSEITRLNAAPADSVIRISEWLSDCLLAAESLNKASGGVFDVTAEPLKRLWKRYGSTDRLPSRTELDSVRGLLGQYTFDSADRSVVKHRAETCFDLGVIARGFAVDRAVANLIDAGISAALIDLGGNVFCLGIPHDGQPWRVGIHDPLDPDKVIASLPASNRALATCDDSEPFSRDAGYAHIPNLNPAGVQPAEKLLSVTVIGRHATMCAGVATALHAIGLAEATHLLHDVYPRYDAVLIAPATPDHPDKIRVYATVGLRGNLSLRPEFSEYCRLEYLPR